MSHQGLGWMNTHLALSPGPEFQSVTTGPQHLDSADDAIFLGFTTYEACTLTGGTFYVDQVTGTSPFWKLQLWPLYDNPPNSQFGYPDMTGTVLAETAAFQATGDDYRHEQDFTSAYTATKKQMLALVIRHSSGTISSQNKISVEYQSGSIDDQAFPFIGVTTNFTNVSPTWNDKNRTVPNITCVTNKDYDLGGPAAIGSDWQYTGGYSTDLVMQTIGDRIVNKWVIPTSNKPFEMVIGGFRHHGVGPGQDDAPKVGIWNEAGTFLGGAAAWKPDWQGTQGDASDHYVNYYFDTDVTVESGGTYYIGIERTGTGMVIGRHVISEVKDTGSGISEADEARALRAFRTWPLGANFRMYVWLASDSTPAWKLHSNPGQARVYPYSRMLIDPIVHDVHGKYGTAGDGSGVSVGRGDRGRDRAPSRVKNPLKSGYKLNQAKLIKRENANYGWSPYN